jgi:uncharacterized protein YjdB
MKKYSMRLSLVLAIVLVFGNCSFTNADVKAIKLGSQVQGTLSVNNSAAYVINFSSTMKVKLKVDAALTDYAGNQEVAEDDRDFEILMMSYDDYKDYLEMVAEDVDNADDDNDDAFYDEYDDEDDDEDEEDDDDIDYVIRDFVDIGEGYEENLEVEGGKYVFVINNDDCEINYKFLFKDISEYTKVIKLNKKKLTLKAKKSVKLVASPKKKGKYITKVFWKSSSKKVAKVDRNGKVTAVKAGQCTISAWVKGGKKVKCVVTVKGKK